MCIVLVGVIEYYCRSGGEGLLMIFMTVIKLKCRKCLLYTVIQYLMSYVHGFDTGVVVHRALMSCSTAPKQ